MRYLLCLGCALASVLACVAQQNPFDAAAARAAAETDRELGQYGSNGNDRGGVIYSPEPGSIQALWSHVYHQPRLQIITLKAHADGILVKCRPEKDGDLHCLLQLSAGQESLLNQANIEKQHGYLVVEPICVGKVTQADAIAACKGYVNHVTVPPPGSCVRVYGSHVVDTEHGWREIHPASAFEVLACKPADGESDAEDAALNECVGQCGKTSHNPCIDLCQSRQNCPAAD